MNDLRATEFAIVGAGAIGSILGAHLVRAGHAVTLYARGARLQRLACDGIRIRGLVEFAVPVVASDRPEELRSAQVLIVATKAIDTRATLARFRNATPECVLSIQNGVLKNDLLSAAFGRERVLGALANTSGEMQPDGAVLFTRNVNLLVGELDGRVSTRAQQIATALDTAGVRATAATDVVVQEWSKYVGWVGLIAAALVTRANSWRYLCDPGSALLVVRLVRELAAIARAERVELSDDSVLPVVSLSSDDEHAAVARVVAIGEGFRARAPEHRISALQDLLAGRPLELEETLGDALRRADEHGVHAPLLRTFVPLLGAIERTAR